MDRWKADPHKASMARNPAPHGWPGGSGKAPSPLPPLGVNPGKGVAAGGTKGIAQQPELHHPPLCSFFITVVPFPVFNSPPSPLSPRTSP